MFKHNYSILLVEDESCARKLLSDRIGKIPQVTMAASMPNGFCAQKYLCEHVVDIILTDIKMPLMDGLELAAFAKEYTPNCQIVFLSGHEEFEYARKAIQYGVKGYLMKPIQFGQVIEVVETCAKEVEKRREELILLRHHAYKELEEQIHRTFSRGETSEQWIPHLNDLMQYSGTIVSIEPTQATTRKKEELAVVYRNILSDALPKHIILQLECTQKQWQYLIIPQHMETFQLVKAIPEYLDRILEQPVKWTEIGEVSSAQELVHWFDTMQKDNGNTSIEAACCYMEKHLGRSITREEVAESVWLSPSYFSYLFKKNKGIGYNEYLTELRIQKAKEMLMHNVSVADIAAQVGFLDARYFSNIFRKKTGYTPSEYRRTFLDSKIE